MSKSPATMPKPPKPKTPRAKRAPNELSLAVKSYNALHRKQAARDRLVARIEVLDIDIAELQSEAAANMKTVNDAIYGPDVPAQEAN
jgi:hypothetical protein